MLDSNSKGVSIHVKFKLPIDSIFYTLAATGQEQNSSAIDGNLRLVKGRIYYLPIDNTVVDSDTYNTIKVFSNISNSIEVRFIKEGYACVIPIIHNVLIKDKQQLCKILS